MVEPLETRITPATLTWDGSASNLWNNAANWDLNQVPADGDTLVFPEAAANLINTNNVSGLDLVAIQMFGPNYVIGGNALTISGGISADIEGGPADDPSELNFNITLAATPIFNNTGSAPFAQAREGLVLGGALNLNGFVLTLAGNAFIEIDGVISGSGGLIKSGTNSVILSGANTFTGATSIVSGAVQVASDTALGAATAGNFTTIADGAALRLAGGVNLPEFIFASGTGVLGTGAVVNQSGNNTLSGTLSLLGNATLSVPSADGTLTLAGTLQVLVDGTAPGSNFETLTFTGAGTLALGGPLTITGDFVAPQDTEFVLLNHAGTGAISGAFQGFPDGNTFSNNSRTFVIDYQGGSGNDISLTAGLPSFRWDNGGGDGKWSNPANWLSDQVPFAGAQLIFPDGFQPLQLENDLPAGTEFHSIVIAGPGYLIAGHFIVLSQGITAGINGEPGLSTLALSVTLAGDQVLEIGNGLTLRMVAPLNLNGATLTVDSTGALEMTDSVSGTGRLIKTGLGTMLLSGSNTYEGLTIVETGQLFVRSGTALGATGPGHGTFIADGGQVVFQDSLTLAEEFSLSGAGSAPIDGAIGSGRSGDVILTGPLILDGDASILLNSQTGPTASSLTLAGPLRLDITGADPAAFETLTVDTEILTTFQISGALELGGTFQPDVGTIFTIVTKTGPGAIAGTFDGLPEGATFTHNGREFRINYTPSAVALTVTASKPTFTWDGGGADANWKTAANWAGDVAPSPGSVLVFPAGAAQLTNSNNFSAGTGFHSIRFEGASYVITGNRIALAAGVVSDLSNTGLGPNLKVPITLVADQSFTAIDTLSLGGTIALNGRSLTFDGGFIVDGAITGHGAVVKGGPDGLTLNNTANTYTGKTSILSGFVNANSLGASGPGNETIVASGATLQLFPLNDSAFREEFILSGTGLPGQSALVVNDAADLAGSFALVGDASVELPLDLVTLSGALMIDIESSQEFETLTLFASVVNVSTLALEGALVIGGAFLPAVGSTFTIIDAGIDVQISGTFDGLPEGSTFASNGRRFQISYTGGDGNDVVLTTVAPQDDLALSADGRSATFTDVDGDRVTVRTTRGQFAADGSDFVLASRTDARSQLQTLKLGPSFAGANVTISAKPGPGGGNGFVNVGFLDAAGVDLGTVKISGDLGRVLAGTPGGDAKVPALKSLSVQSIGLLGATTQEAGGSITSTLQGGLPKVTIFGDLRGSLFVVGAVGAKIGTAFIGGSFTAGSGNQFISADGDIGSLTIGGDIRSAAPDSAVISSGGLIGALTVGGSIRGASAAPMGITAFGQINAPAAGMDFAIKKIAVRGTVESTFILAGFSQAQTNADASIGSITVGGDWIASRITVGTNSGQDFAVGTDDDAKFTTNAVQEARDHPTLFSTIGSLVIQGQALGTVGISDMNGIVAERIGKARIGTRTLAFANDDSPEGFFAAPTGPGSTGLNSDFTIREIGSTTSNLALAIDLQISADGRTATFTDVDGDLVTIKTSAGAFVPADFTIVAGPTGGGQLQKIDLSDNGPDFTGADLTVTALPGPLGGNGFVNVGEIKAGNTPLGKVSVDGDLVSISISVVGTEPAAKSLTVHSLNALGLTPNGFNFFGGLGKLTVTTDIRRTVLFVDGRLGPVVVGGSLLGDSSLFASAEFASLKLGGSVLGAEIGSRGAIGSLLIGGDLIGDGSGPTIAAFGQFVAPAKGRDLAIKSLIVKGNVENALVNAATNPFASTADASIGVIAVSRSWLASSVQAGVVAGTDTFLGTSDDLKVFQPNARDNAVIVSQIASITIKGQAFGSAASGDSFGIVAEQIGKALVGKVKLPFQKGPGTPNDAFFIAPTFPGFGGGFSDFSIREVV